MTRELGRLGFKSTKVTPKTEAGKGAPGSPGDGVDDVADAGVGSPSVSSSKTRMRELAFYQWGPPPSRKKYATHLKRFAPDLKGDVPPKKVLPTPIKNESK